jgi:hypothetical protein
VPSCIVRRTQAQHLLSLTNLHPNTRFLSSQSLLWLMLQDMALLTPIRTVVRITLLVTLPMLKDSTIPLLLTVIHHSMLTRAIRATWLALPPPPMLLAVPMVSLTTDTILSSHTGVILQLHSSRLTSLHRSTQLLLAVPRRIVRPPQLRADKLPLLSPQWNPSKCAISELWRLTCSSLVFVSSRSGNGITLHDHVFFFVVL